MSTVAFLPDVSLKNNIFKNVIHVFVYLYCSGAPPSRVWVSCGTWQTGIERFQKLNFVMRKSFPIQFANKKTLLLTYIQVLMKGWSLEDMSSSAYPFLVQILHSRIYITMEISDTVNLVTYVAKKMMQFCFFG